MHLKNKALIFPLPIPKGRQDTYLELPLGSQPLSAFYQDGGIFLVVRTTPVTLRGPRRIFVVLNGHEIPKEATTFLWTMMIPQKALNGQKVGFHLFDGGVAAPPLPPPGSA